MIYGDTYKKSLRNPSEPEREFVEKSIPYIMRQSRKKIEDAQRWLVISSVITLCSVLLGSLSNLGVFVLCFLPTLFFGALMAVCQNEYAVTKHHTAKLHSGKYNVATGVVDHYNMRKKHCEVQGRIGVHLKSKINFLIDRAFVEETDWTCQLSFLCVVVDEQVYALSKTERGKPIVSMKAEIFSINTDDYRLGSQR